MLNYLLVLNLFLSITIAGCSSESDDKADGNEQESTTGTIAVVTGVEPTPTPPPNTEEDPSVTGSVYVKGSLFDDSGDSFLPDHQVTYVPGTLGVASLWSENQFLLAAATTVATTNDGGEYSFEVPIGEGVHTFNVEDGDGNDKGDFSIAVDAEGKIDISRGVELPASPDFMSSVPSVTKVAQTDTSSKALADAHSVIPGGTSAEKAAMVEVIHRSVLERFYKSGWRLDAKNLAGVHKQTMVGPEGGTARYIIIGDPTGLGAYDIPIGGTGDNLNSTNDVDGPSPSAGITSDKLHVIDYDNYAKNGLVIDGTIAFVFGYESYTGGGESGFVYQTDPAWDTSNIQDVVNFIEYRSSAGLLNRPHIYDELLGLSSINTLSVTGAYTDTVTFSFDILNMETAITKESITAVAAASAYHWRDTLEFNYSFATAGAPAVEMTELTGTGIYKRTYSGAMNDLQVLSKTAGLVQEYSVDGPEGGSVTLKINKEPISGGGYTVMETYIFDGYAANSIVLNATYNAVYKIDAAGVYSEASVTPASINITGYFNSSARHKFIIWDNGSNFQHTDWYFVDECSEGFQRVSIIFPVSIIL